MEEARSSRPAVWVMKTFKKRVPGLKFCWSVPRQYTESHGGCVELLEPYSQTFLGLSHPSLLQGLQHSAPAPREHLLFLREASSSPWKELSEKSQLSFKSLLPDSYVPPGLAAPPLLKKGRPI